ncbi:MAG: hypothetical protein ACTHMS_19140 [Jatrophihabitans sp.]|uniref:hypothetical protein n=1 Tax=Jatrophihabitans sp. TaxID=1932789 RepID=UPI003F80D512
MSPERLRHALKRSAAALTDAGIDFALGGSYALWVHGAAEPVHDVDLVVPEADADQALAALDKAGFRTERPPEGWLYKAWDCGEGADEDEVLVDLLFQQNGRAVTAATVRDAPSHQVLGVWMPVLPAQQIMVAKFRAMNEHYCDFGALLPPVRAVREQLDWDDLERATADNDFAVAFLVLLRRLGIAPDAA